MSTQSDVARREVLPSAATVMSQAGDENFPIASHVLPRATRRHLLAVYGFARLVDDTGDEALGDRPALLDRIEADVDRVYNGDEPDHPLVRNLATTVRAFAIPDRPLRALIEANRRDQRQRSYATFDDLLRYCIQSANPVGELVLCVFQALTPERLCLSDDICTGLQLAEHWQDVSEDLARGRVYLPAEDLERFGCTTADLAAPRASEPVRGLISFEVARTHRLLDRGARLVGTFRGQKAVAVAAFVAGGRAALGAIERMDYDVLAGTPKASRRARLAALAATLIADRRDRNT